MSGPAPHSDHLTQDSSVNPAHRNTVDPAARTSKKVFEGMSASSIGLELGIAVVLGTLGGIWADSTFGTEPWLMLVGIGFGCFAGFRGVLRAVAKEDRKGARDDAEILAIAHHAAKDAARGS